MTTPFAHASFLRPGTRRYTSPLSSFVMISSMHLCKAMTQVMGSLGKKRRKKMPFYAFCLTNPAKGARAYHCRHAATYRLCFIAGQAKIKTKQKTVNNHGIKFC
jgi:hypothetical protein